MHEESNGHHPSPEQEVREMFAAYLRGSPEPFRCTCPIPKSVPSAVHDCTITAHWQLGARFRCDEGHPEKQIIHAFVKRRRKEVE
jgi:hypothetical protein